jgi:hypothetical protein
MRTLTLFGLSALTVLATACGASTPEAELAQGPCPPGQYCPASPYATPTATTPGDPAAPAPVAPSAAMPLDLRPVTPLLTALAAQEVAGMTPEGGAMGGSFQSGQVLEQAFTLQPGKCYSVVAVGAPPVEELAVEIVGQPSDRLSPVVLAADQRVGPQAVIGDGGQCFRSINAVAIPAKIVLRVERGSGIAGAQLYVKG